MQFVSTMAPSYSSSSSGVPAAAGEKTKESGHMPLPRGRFPRGSCQFQLLTLKTRLPSQNLPEVLNCMTARADTLLDELDVVSPATQISLALDEVCQL